MHPRNDQVLVNGHDFCLTPVYCAYPLPPCAFSYPGGDFISLQCALSPVAWALDPPGTSGDACLFPSSSPHLLPWDGRFRASCCYQKFTQYLALEGEGIWGYV